MRITMSIFLMIGVAMFLVSCASSESEDQRFEQIAADYIEEFLEMNPESATELGDHRFDSRMNDYSVDGIRTNLEFNRSALELLERIRPEKLSNTNRIDYAILRNRVEGMVFRLGELKEHEWNPLSYNIGGAIYYLIARDFAPLEQRLESVRARLEQFPTVTAFAKSNLENPPKVHVETAIQQNAGTISLIENELQQIIDEAGLDKKFVRRLNKARKKATDALRYYGGWLEYDLMPEATGDFRIGEDLFRKKLHYVLHSDLDMEEILRRAEADLVDTQNQMMQVAMPIYDKLRPRQGVTNGPVDKRIVIKTVLDYLAESVPNNETIVTSAEQFLAECIEFTKANNLVTVPDDPVELIVMPEFQRGVAVAYCDAPGPLEKEGKTFYAISPTPKDWTEDRVTSFFREYNDYMLHDLTIHEAVPGHYLQLAHSNRFKAPTKVRAIFYSGPFVEGWATYSEQLMAEKGYGGPEVHMQQLKMRLRMIINSIIDQKIHTAGMTEQEAMDLMMKEGFQEEGESAGKWRRACMTSTQLSTYYVGNIEVNDIRKAYEAKHGTGNMKEMHDKMLSFGSPPSKYVKQSLGL